MIDGKTKVYGILGNPVAHSLSPLMQNRAFEECGLNSIYLPFRTEDVAGAMAGLKSLDIQGASVTVPHKEAVMAFLDTIDPVAEKIGSVNTIVVTRGSEGPRLVGYNTDWLGANHALQDVMSLQGATMVVLGAGGAARAVGFGLLEAGASVTLCSRTEKKGRQLAAELGCSWVSLQDAHLLSGDGLVNATSVGMVPEVEKSPVTQEVCSHFHVVMDIVYAPLMTKLLQQASSCGCRIVSGIEMLLYQGVAQFELWNSVKAPVDAMRQVVYQATGNSHL